MFRHPKYYKELRKRNRDLLELSRSEQAQDRSVPQSDQAISEPSSTEQVERAPDPGPKQQAIEETVPHNDIEEAQASSSKLQASSPKLLKQ